jgi:prevent-host-death family protein
MKATRRVGVRELRQNLSVHLRAVRAGRTLEVTEHGHPVAILAPLPKASTSLERIVASGRAIPPSRNLSELPAPPRKGRVSTRLSKALRELRDERL